MNFNNAFFKAVNIIAIVAVVAYVTLSLLDLIIDGGLVVLW